jgi:nucleoside-diphosphate-sugar epimerase
MSRTSAIGEGRVLVTGANGFVGHAVVARLRSIGRPVRLAVRVPNGRSDAVRVPDVGPDARWEEALDGVEVVIHLAARVHVMREGASDPLAEFMRTNVAGTDRLAREAARAGVRRFVFASSIKVLGEEAPIDAPFDDASPPRPLEPYGVSKLEAERALLAVAASTRLEVAILRPPLMHGPGVGGNLALLLAWIGSGWPLPFGAIDNRRSLLAVDNFADALIRAGDHPAAAGHAFVVSDSPPLSTPELVRRLARGMGRPVRLLPVPPSWLRAAGRATGRGAALERLTGSLCVDGSGFERALGWTPPTDAAAAFEATARAFTADRAREGR